ncbi:MAG: hypothetical protein WCD79_09340 [Chthoniobacteraceae bacterium]
MMTYESFARTPGAPAHRKARFAFLTVVLALTCAACHRQEPAPSLQPQHEADYDLRTFLDIRTVRAPFTLPDTAAGYYAVTLFFVDGQEVARQKGPTLTGLSKAERPFSGEVALIWQTDQGKVIRASLVNGLNKTDLTEHFGALTGKIGTSAWRSFNPGENLNYDGIMICGIYAANGSGNNSSPMLYGDGEKLPSFGKYVVAVGVVSGPDFDKLRDEFTKPVPSH